MAQIANIALVVDSTTYTYTPTSQVGVQSHYQLPGQSYNLNEDIKLTGQQTQSDQANRTAKLLLSVPMEYTDPNGIVSVKTAYVDVKVVVPKVFPTATVTLMRQKAAQLLANALVVDLVDYGRTPY